MDFADVSSCGPEFSETEMAANPGLRDRIVCLDLSRYNGLTFAPVGTAPGAWIAKRALLDGGARGSLPCNGAAIVNGACTVLEATYEGPARNPKAANRQTVTLTGGASFTLKGLQGILYSAQGVRLTGYRRDGSSVSTVLAPNELLNPVFPTQQWSGLESLEFVPDVRNGVWSSPDEYAVLKIFQVDATVC